MAPSQDIESILESLSSLSEMLDGDYTSMALVRSDGTWYLEQNEAVRLQKQLLSTDSCGELIDFLRRQGPVVHRDKWWAHCVSAPHASTVVFERRPVVEPDGLSPHTLELLRARLEPNANGVVFGPSRHARTGLLLSLTRHLPSGLVLYVGPVPPMEPEDRSLVHVAPPRHDRDRRELAPLFERAAVVLFDGPVNPADLRLLLSGSHSTNRWIAVDAPDQHSWIDSALESLHSGSRITTRIGVRTTSVDKIRVNYFAEKVDDHWNVLLDGDHSADDVAQDHEITRAEQSRLSAQLTSPIDRRAPSRRKEDPPADDPSPPDGDDIPPFDVAALMAEDESPQALRESGQIDVPGFTSPGDDSTDGSGKITADPTDALRGQKIDGALPGLVAASDIDDVEIPELEPAQLRQTFDGSVADIKDLNRATTSDEDEEYSPADSDDDDPNTEPIDIDDDSSDDRDDNSSLSENSEPFTRRPTSSARKRSLRRTSQLGAEVSTGRRATDNKIADRRTSRRRRYDTSGRRVLPVPSASTSSAGSETTTRDLSPLPDQDASSDRDDASSPPPPIEVHPDDSAESTIELHIDKDTSSQGADSSDE